MYKPAIFSLDWHEFSSYYPPTISSSFRMFIVHKIIVHPYIHLIVHLGSDLQPVTNDQKTY